MSNIGEHEPRLRTVAIAVLTFRRPDDLGRCLRAVAAALDVAAPSLDALMPTVRVEEIIVVDNDPSGSARQAASATGIVGWPIRYINETNPGVANARNRALDECGCDIVVFIDDDEVPGDEWPHGLLEAMAVSGAALVGGPVDTLFTEPPPSWITDGGFFDRDNPPHLAHQEWLRSGNLAIDMAQIRSVGLRFDPRRTVSEDVAFSRAARQAGLSLVWSRSGSISEFVGPDRFTVAWRLRREFLAQQGWAAITVELADQDRPRLRTIVRGLTIVASGIVGLARSAVSPSKAGAVLGLTGICGGVGRLSGLRRR